MKEMILGARAALVRRLPYLAALLLRLRLVETGAEVAMAVDQHGRVYYNPAVLERLTAGDPGKVAGILLHEAYHLLFRHFARAKAQGVGNDPQLLRVWNYAADAEVNPAVERANLPLPAEGVWPRTLGLEPGKHAEYYYRRLLESPPEFDLFPFPMAGGGVPMQASPDPGSLPMSGEGGAGTEGSEDGNGGGTSRADGQSGKPGAENAEGAGNGAPAQATPDPGSLPMSGEGGAGAEGSEDGNGGGTSREGGQSGTGGRDSSEKDEFAPLPGGSAADGVPRPWELPPDDAEHPGIEERELDRIRRQVAVQLGRHLKDRGSLPAGLARLVEEYLEPQVDWRRELLARVKHAAQQQAGQLDQSWARASRRDHPDFIFPGWVEPAPEIAAVIDTSSSMGDRELAAILGEVREILRTVSASVRYYATDAEVQEAGNVHRIEGIRLAGGGGTDMRVGIQAALEGRPRPNILLVFTDGYTPWPAEPPDHRVEVIPVVLGEEGLAEAPGWVREQAIVIDD